MEKLTADIEQIKACVTPSKIWTQFSASTGLDPSIDHFQEFAAGDLRGWGQLCKGDLGPKGPQNLWLGAGNRTFLLVAGGPVGDSVVSFCLKGECP